MSKHRRMWIKHHGAIPEGKHVHHIDGDHLNNDVDNLICVSREMHREIHRQQWEEHGHPKDAYAYNSLDGENPIKMVGDKNPMHGKTHSEESRRKIGNRSYTPNETSYKKGSKPWNKGISLPKFVCSYCGSEIGGESNLNQHIKAKHEQVDAAIYIEKLKGEIPSYDEDAVNKRMDIIGRNGNDGEHYEGIIYPDIKLKINK